MFLLQTQVILFFSLGAIKAAVCCLIHRTSNYVDFSRARPFTVEVLWVLGNLTRLFKESSINIYCC